MREKGLTKREKIETIIAYVEKYKLTAYEIGTYAQDISIPTVDRIIKRETANPSGKNLDIILDYIEKAIIGRENKETDGNRVNEPLAAYYATQELLKTQRELITTQRDLIKEKELRLAALEKELSDMKNGL